MSKDPAFLFYPGDYLRDTQCLSEKVQVAYDRIMCEHMRNICISQSQLNFFTKRLSEDEKSELLMVLSEIEGGFQIQWVAEGITKRKDYSNSRRKNREGKSKKDMNNISESYVKHMENENENENINKEKGGAGEKEKTSQRTKKEEPKKKAYAEKVLMTEEEFNKLSEKYSPEDVQKMIDKLNNHKLSRGTNYKSDYRAVLSWVEDWLLKNNSENILITQKLVKNGNKSNGAEALGNIQRKVSRMYAEQGCPPIIGS